MSQIYIEDNNQIFTDTTWTGNEYGRRIREDGEQVRTFRTATVYLFGSHNTFQGCTFQNTAGPGAEVGQALAIYIDGDENTFDHCTFYGHQDTVFLAPLPPKEIEPGGFTGPGRDLPRTPRVTYFKDCTIEGGVDFVFGGGTAYFDHCTFISNEPGYVFAPSTPEDVETGFVCRDCRFESRDLDAASCYLGRPWRNYAAVTLEHCWMDAHIAPAGWHDWNKEAAHETVRFVEINSYGPGANNAMRPAWVNII